MRLSTDGTTVFSAGGERGIPAARSVALTDARRPGAGDAGLIVKPSPKALGTERSIMRRTFEIGGIVAAVVLVAFGVAAIAIGLNGRSTVKDNLAEQKIVGTPDMTPSGIRGEAAKAGLNASQVTLPTCNVANKAVTNGSTARCFAEYMKVHALEATGGEVYSQMPRFLSTSGTPTSNEAQAQKSPSGKPVENPARNVWVQETALSTALNTSYMAEQISLFGVVMGVALLLSGLGFAVLSIGGALRNPDSVLSVLRARRTRSGGAATAAPSGA
jgi:hypothetical protein